jgi:dihydroflavonol-4-reductase
LVRDPGRASALQALGAELVVGDIADEAALARGLEGAEVAYHLAAVYRLGLVDTAEMERTNVEGTRAFLAAVASAGTARAVYVSSTAALGPTGRSFGDGTQRWSVPYPTHYHRTKARAHELALAAQAAGLPLLIACPAFVYGQGDRGPTGDFLRDLLGGRLPALVRDPAWFMYVHVADVAEALALMAERGRPGATYVLGGEGATFTDFAQLVVLHANRRLPRFMMPRALALAVGGSADLVSRVTGRRLAISREGVRSVTRDRWLFETEPAERELGWRPRPLAAMLRPVVMETLREIT